MRLTPEQVAEEKKYLSELKERVWIGEHGLTNAEQDLFDTIEALQAENEQLRAQVATLKNIKEMLHKCMAVRMMPDKVERVVNDALAEIDKAIGGEEDV